MAHFPSFGTLAQLGGTRQVLGRVWRIPQQLGGSLDHAELSGEMTDDRYIFHAGRILDFEGGSAQVCTQLALSARNQSKR